MPIVISVGGRGNDRILGSSSVWIAQIRPIVVSDSACLIISCRLDRAWLQFFYRYVESTRVAITIERMILST